MDELGVKELKFDGRNCSSKPTCKSYFRVNTLKTTKETLRAILMDLDIDTDYLKINQML
jgi:16S rRNA (cytosine967-C5)-methyltransferase